MKTAAMDAMKALFQFADAMDEDVSIKDLQDVMELAISEGHDMLLIALTMAQIALKATGKCTEK
jgi:hypothetical protein